MSGKGICRFSGGAFGLCSCFFFPATKMTYTHASLKVQNEPGYHKVEQRAKLAVFPRTVMSKFDPSAREVRKPAKNVA